MKFFIYYVGSSTGASIGKKRKAPQDISSENIRSKKAKIDESTIILVNGPQASSSIYGPSTVHGDHAYFVDNFNTICEFYVPTRSWKQLIKCPQACFGLTTIENELVAVGGAVKTGESLATTSKVLCFSLTEKTWCDDKYPPMKIARGNPKVVVSGKYLIALGGETEPENRTNSVEVLDIEEKQWYSSDQLNLPEEFQWLSACICNKDIFVVGVHNDPNFRETMEGIVDNDVDSPEDWSYECYHNEELDPHPYPCFSMYRCSVDTMVQIVKESVQIVKENSKMQVWQPMQHPHPSVYAHNKKPNAYSLTHISDYFFYNDCDFSLLCFNEQDLVAIGCSHIKETSHTEVKRSLKLAYYSYREARKEVNYLTDPSNVLDPDEIDETLDVIDSVATKDGKTHIYIYNKEQDSWEHVTSKQDDSKDYPSAAVVDNKIVIVRNS